ncbi:hypothetical protein FY558_18055 [Vibrio cholerae]|nr:hypothetical protein FY558_18055 [Vibrio cholerae]
MVTVVVFEFGVMRCQPLRRALAKSKIVEYRDVFIRMGISCRLGFRIGIVCCCCSGTVSFKRVNAHKA